MFFCQRASQSVLKPGSANGFAFPPGAPEARPLRMLLAVEATAMVLTETPLKNSRRFIDELRLYFESARRQHLSPRPSVGTSRRDVRPAFSRAFAPTARGATKAMQAWLAAARLCRPSTGRGRLGEASLPKHAFASPGRAAVRCGALVRPTSYVSSRLSVCFVGIYSAVIKSPDTRSK